MTNKNIDLEPTTKTEEQVLDLLKNKGEYLYGNIIKELKLSTTIGASVINSLTAKGYIKRVNNTSVYELNN